MRRRTVVALAVMALIFVGVAAAMSQTTLTLCQAGQNASVFGDVTAGSYSAFATLYNPYQTPKYWSSPLAGVRCVPRTGQTECSAWFYTVRVALHTQVRSITVSGAGRWTYLWHQCGYP